MLFISHQLTHRSLKDAAIVSVKQLGRLGFGVSCYDCARNPNELSHRMNPLNILLMEKWKIFGILADPAPVELEALFKYFADFCALV